MATKCTAAAAVAEAKRWIGYLEKKSNKDLDSFTANAGKANYTRFNRDLISYKQGIGAQPMEWCGSFVSCVFVYAFGLNAALRLLAGSLYCYTPSGAAAFRKAGRYIKRGQGRPQPGDVVFFWSSAKGRIGHTGIVYKVSGSTVYTIEGNTSGGSTLITNGGGVAAKKYALSSSYIDGYGRPDYADVNTDTERHELELGDRLLTNGTTGDDVKELQEALIRLGYDLGRWGADGDFGDCTEMAVRRFQAQNGLAVDGEAGPQTIQALRAVLAAQKVEENPSYVEIVGGSCYVREEPSTAGDIRGVALEHSKLIYGGKTTEDGWHAVVYKDKPGWMSGRYGKLVSGK